MEVRRVPRVIVEWFEGRTLDQKRMLAKLITEAVLQVDSSLKSDAVEVLYRDIDKADYAKGGVLRVDR
jgi:4-oxalocrotonate tautomerase